LGEIAMRIAQNRGLYRVKQSGLFV